MTILIIIAILVVIVIPNPKLVLLFSSLREKTKVRTLLIRGEELNFWLAQCRLDQVGFDLERALPDKNIYKHFGLELHYAWDQVRQYGGGLGNCLSGLREILRQDLKFERKKRTALHGAYAQVFMMLVMSWLYLAAYIILDLASLSIMLITLTLGWQVLGAIIYGLFLKYKEKHFFKASLFFMHHLIKLKVFTKGGGHLTALSRPVYLESLSKHEAILYDKICHVVALWRDLGHVHENSLVELEDEYWLCLEEKIEKYLSLLNKTAFLWSLIFILPSLFATSFFSMSELMISGQ